MGQLPWPSLPIALGLSLSLLGGELSAAWAQAPLNPEIKVGIVQRFGETVNAQIVLKPLAGDLLTVKFQTNGQPQTLTTNQVTLTAPPEALSQTFLQEWVVLSTHKSFESAEESALRWQAAGIEAEIAQPDSWQVWAKREVYNTPLLKRLLLNSLKAAGYSGVYIDSELVTQMPQAAFIVNGYRYNREQFDIVSANRRIQVTQGETKSIYGGDLRIQPNAYGTYTLVNQVPIELYLRGVVPHEIGPSAPQSAVEAQAILARTYALRNLRRFAIDNYQMCADTQCQVYRGLSGTDPEADAAIATTRGQVLTYGNELVDALYSSTTGGVTARFNDVWNGPDRPYLQPVVDSIQTPWDLVARPLSDETAFRNFVALKTGFNEDDWPTFRWQRPGTLEELTTGLKAYLTNRQHPLASLTKLTKLTITERAASGRVQKIMVETDAGTFELAKNEIVSALIPPRSLFFYIEPMYQPSAEPPIPASQDAGSTPGTVAVSTPALKGYNFIGGGFGHGVGMSQTGSYRLARQGWPYPRILEFYYPGTQLQPIHQNLVFWQPAGGAAVHEQTKDQKSTSPQKPIKGPKKDVK